MEEEKGFYKLETGARRKVLLFATHLESKDLVLDVSLKDTYTYPIDGWTYHDNLSEACLLHNVDEEEARQRLFPNEDEIFTELV